MIKYQDGANATRTRERSPIPVLTHPDVQSNYADRDQHATTVPNHHGYAAVFSKYIAVRDTTVKPNRRSLVQALVDLRPNSDFIMRLRVSRTFCGRNNRLSDCLQPTNQSASHSSGELRLCGAHGCNKQVVPSYCRGPGPRVPYRSTPLPLSPNLPPLCLELF